MRLRPYRDSSDLAGMQAVHDGCREADRTDPFSVCYTLPNFSADEYTGHIAGLLRDSGPESLLIAEVSGEIVGHGCLEWWNEFDSKAQAERRAYLSRGWVLPQWRGQGIGTAMLQWAESLAKQRDTGRLSGELAANASDGEQDSMALLAAAGYELRFLSVELAADGFDTLPPLSLPNGFHLRPLETAHQAAVARALIESNADPTVSLAQRDAWVASELAGWVEFVAGCDPALSRIAWQGDQVAGLFLCKNTRGSGDVANVAVLPQFRRRGLARALMNHCLHAMRDAGLSTARVYTSIGTDRNEPPSGPFLMYQKFGFRPVAYHNRYRKAMIK